MLNQIILVGRITSEVKTIKENDKKVAYIHIAIPRNFKNADGEYETDFIPVVLWNVIAQNTAEYCRKGDVIGVRGRIQQNGEKIEIVAEKVTFLSSKKADEQNE